MMRSDQHLTGIILQSVVIDVFGFDRVIGMVRVGIPKGGFEQEFVKTVPIPSACCWPFVDEEGK